MTTSPMASLTIPANLLEDVRTAIVSGIEDDGNALQTNQRSVLEGFEFGAPDRAASMRLLLADAALLGQILDAEDEATVSGAPEAVSGALEGTMRVLIDRLKAETEVSPLETGTVRDLAERLLWAAGESLALEEVA